jgi:hypothetical protein
MAVSKVAIANRALQKLGAKRIESMTQDHPNARTVSACFDILRDALLRKYDWSFAIKRDSIAADGDSPEWGDWDQYTKPNDFIRLLRDDESGTAVDWKIEGDFILSRDGAPLEIRYIARIEDTNKYDASFVEALAAEIAHECCYEITGSHSKEEKMKADKNDAIDEGKRTGAIEKEAQEFPEDEWLTARR